MRSRQSSVKRPDAMNLKQSIQTLWPYITKFKGRVLIAILALVGAKGATLLMPWALKEIIDAVDKSINPLLLVPTLLLVMYGALRFASVFLGEVRDAVFSRVTEHAMRDIGLKVFKHLHSLDLAFHLDRQTGGISRDIERGTSGLSFLMRFLMFNIVPTLFEIITVAIIFGTLFSIWFALITLLAVAIYIFFTVTVTQWRNRFIRESNAADNQSNTRAIDSLLNYETVKYFSAEDREAKDYDDSLWRWEQARRKNRLSLFALNAGQALIIASAMTAMMLLAGAGVRDGSMSIGDFVLINAFMMQLFLPLNFLGFVYREIKGSMANIERMFDMLEVEPAIVDQEGAEPLVLSPGVPPEVEFKDVSFRYSDEREILKGISFTIAPGERLAVVGSSGAGKSTLVKLLFRFYDPTPNATQHSGSVKINGQAIQGLQQKTVRDAIGIVPQDTVLFNDSIQENIRYGRIDASDEEVRQAIKLAHLEGFISSLPMGVDTKVGERGLKLSGGEKQRVAIARTILKGAPIMVFDEATSSLDSRSEQAIMTALKELQRGHTSLTIAHRLSTIADADRIIVMGEGQIIEQGSHQELMDRNSAYSALWQAQEREQHSSA